VLESRILETEKALRRRRQCQECQRRFTTYERLAMSPVLVTKRDGRKELFDRRKLLEGINRACIHTRVSVADMEQIVDAIEQRIASRPRPEATSAEIGEMILDELLPLDEVAYVRFASVYRHFASVDDFIRELQQVQRLSGATV
jgi:transcriptional repressor NrdR